MTETSPVAITHPTTEPYPVTTPLNSPIVNGTVSDSAAPEDEEEPYTIKCICAFEDDDGNTVFCEGCETWQHIVCYYHSQAVPDVHNCVDCEPRYLDGRRATDRQRRLREQSDGGDRKPKRSAAAKSHKKKAKEHGDQVNGFHQRSESSSRDLPPSKKAKTSHRASGSVSSLSGVPTLASDARKRTAASMSPAKPSVPSISRYSNEFLHLYDRDHGHVDMEGNLFVNLTLAADLASWVKDPTALARVANGRAADEIFTRSGAALDRSHWPYLSLESISDSNTEIDGKHPTWKVLKTQNRVGKDEIVGEITGKIGLLRDYSLDPSNRWQELRHPEPFVFFHPQLPIYIDSRQEGSILRYARRSCRPNVTMKTYITNEVEYHFCFVAKEDIPPGSEITATWYLDAQLFGSTNGLVKQEPGDSVPEIAATCISNVLANFGGCACVPSPNCLLSSLDRRRYPKNSDGSSKQGHAKRRKTKSKSNITPPANNSRAGSETIKNLEEDDPVDSRSASGSARGQTRSRDLTPTLQTPTDVQHTFGDSELSARERRKIAAAEKKFQQLEQDQQASHKRKKRVSGQSTQTAGTSTSDRQSYSPPLSAGRHSSPRKPSFPSTPETQYPSSHSHYVDSAVQAELDFARGEIPSTPSSKRPSFTPLTQRLLKRCHIDRVRLGQTSLQQPPSLLNNIAPSGAVASSSHGVPTPTATTPSVSGEKEDVEMQDSESPTGSLARLQTRSATVETSPSIGRGTGKSLPPPPWPSSAAHITRIPAHKARSPRVDLHVPLPQNTATSLPLATSPNSAISSTVSSPITLDPSSQNPGNASPGAGMAAPSPVKKKLSLGDYLMQRGSLKTPASEKTQAQATAMPPPTPPTQPSEKPDSLAMTNSTHPEAGASTQTDDPSSLDVAGKNLPGSTQTTHLPSTS
ncbi:putative PHD finger and SET domain protein [Aspergillus lucknowensis]|uniref:SET domain-containing protein n=1 Tax=Aspergillus lucknowensis TaxID=176173 RepID=A0ABR4M6V5_9EURO